VPVYPVCSRAAPHPVGRNRNTGDRTVRAPSSRISWASGIPIPACRIVPTWRRWTFRDRDSATAYYSDISMVTSDGIAFW